jgi:hypothetical protein
MSTIKSSTTTTTAYQVVADTTGALVIQTGATPTTAVTVGADQSVTFAQAANLPNTFGFKNRIINGAMVINQRATSITASGYSVDRFAYFGSVASKATISQETSIYPTGFINSLKVLSSSAYTVGSTEEFEIYQSIEGLNVADLNWGTATASTVTLSFWVYSSLTGTFGGALQNSASNRSYPYSYTISTANTWEQKTITIAGDTSGTWLKTNGIGIAVYFGLGVGSTKSTTAGAWAAGYYTSATGATSVVGTNGATFYITGVQLEKGSTATSFDYRPFGTELQLCQRYFSTSFPYGTAPVQNSGLYTWKVTMLSSGYGTFSQIQYPVPMRITGTTITGYNGGAANTLVRAIPVSVDITILGTSTTSTTGFVMQCYGGSGDGTGQPIGWNWSASAEL